ncbi:MAG TPA: protein kinase [Pirellulales bacterium]|nr:protein kinase [Pirellulales bacterium]
MAKKRQKKTSLLPLEGAFPDEFSTVTASLSRRYQYVDEVAKGKTGLACRLRNDSNNNHFYCLKTVRHDITDPEKIEAIRDTLRKEVLILSPLSHRCLPTIYEHDLAGSKPYYVCTYHPGSTFGEFKARSESLKFQETVFVLSSLLDVLKYLHSNGRTHCDLHQNNVMISRDVLRHGVLVIDFSSGHRDSDSSSYTGNRGNVNFKDPQGQRYSGASVDRREFSVSFQDSDFNALGKLLAIMRDCFIAKAPPATQAAYDDFSESLQSGKLDSWTKIEDRFLSVLDPYRVVTENGDLFLSNRGVPQEIRIAD